MLQSPRFEIVELLKSQRERWLVERGHREPEDQHFLQDGDRVWGYAVSSV